MQAIFSVTVPFFALVLCGYLASRTGALPSSAVPGLNVFVLYFALPCMLLRFGLAGLLSVPFWHAPALVHWGGQPAAKALFFSLMACWRNRGAFFVYALTWAAVILLFAVVANLLFAMLGHIQWMAAAAMPASLVFSTVFYVSLYFTFADCFDMDAVDSPDTSTVPPGGAV